MGKRLAGLLFLLFMLAIPTCLVCTGGYQPLLRAAKSHTAPLERVEQVLQSYFPAAETLRRMRISLNYMGGNKEQNHVFISEDALMLDVQPKDQQTINLNINGLLHFSEKHQRTSYVMIIPTACAVQQYKVPYDTVAPLYNQKQQLIDDVYRRVSGHLTSIDVYPLLSDRQNEYIYYRTDNNPTGLGGYYIYTVAAQKLGLKPRTLSEFDVKHLDYQYYGDLYGRSPYRQIPPDRVSAYIFSRHWRSYTVTHYDQNGTRRYYTLYPEFRKEIDSAKGVLLGGVSSRIDIDISNPQYTNQLLIFGDRSVQSYLPFLLIHYQRVTFIDTTQVSANLLADLDISDYNQVLFAYSADSFVTEDLSSILSRLPSAE